MAEQQFYMIVYAVSFSAIKYLARGSVVLEHLQQASQGLGVGTGGGSSCAKLSNLAFCAARIVTIYVE